MEQAVNQILNFEKCKTYENWRDTIDLCIKDIENFDSKKDIVSRIENFINFLLKQDIVWSSKIALESNEETYRESLTAISLLMEKLPFIKPEDSFSIKDIFKKIIENENIPINDIFQCNSDIINSLLSHGHYKIAKDLRELGLVYGNSKEEQDNLTNYGYNFFILDTKYLQNIEIISEWILQVKVTGTDRTNFELQYIDRIKQLYGKTQDQLDKLIENPHLLSRDGVALFANAVYYLKAEDLETFCKIKLNKKFKDYSVLYNHHGYKNLDDIYIKNKEISIAKNDFKKDFFEDFLLKENQGC